MRVNKMICLVIPAMSLLSCNQPATHAAKPNDSETRNWKTHFEETLPLLGHRNWIVIADKAFPQQTAPGIEVINTNENLLPVIQYVMQQLKMASHVKPVIYRDKELGYISEDQARGVTQFINDSKQLFNGRQVQTLLHDSVFAKLDATSKLFKVLVLKTNETIPYTSVFLQLDCAYWDNDLEKQMRDRMRIQK